ncbi:hypothetical protein BC834DRAFT_318867 [Gloeopeniophorella convolvens]|nr:hypothetical protein BC834DRAFT_318867 [Gloeopeniophorella convolvens]
MQGWLNLTGVAHAYVNALISDCCVSCCLMDGLSRRLIALSTEMAVLDKLYSNILLVSLNNRISLREVPLESGSTSIMINVSKATTGHKSGRSSLSHKTDMTHKGGLSEA